ncbi:MAG: SH3 domain-containing protein, partial [candidate division WOR-3 bacterium]
LKEPPIIGIVTAKNVNVRKGPGTENEIIKTLNKGNEVRILIIRNDWVLVRYDSNYEGWIHKSLLTYKDSLKTDIKNSKEK